MVGRMKPLGWIGSAREDLLAFPPEVVREIGHVLYVAQIGGKHSAAKPLKGFGGSSVLEVVEDHAGDTFLCGLIPCDLPRSYMFSMHFRRSGEEGGSHALSERWQKVKVAWLKQARWRPMRNGKE